MNRTNDIIGDGVVVFVFSDLGGYGAPKSEEGEEIFNIEHTERMWSNGANVEERMWSQGANVEERMWSQGANVEEQMRKS